MHTLSIFVLSILAKSFALMTEGISAIFPLFALFTLTKRIKEN